MEVGKEGSQKETIIPARYSFLIFTRFMSCIGVMTPATIPNMLPIPSVSNMQKNNTAQT